MCPAERPNRPCFVLGAGFSHPCGLPLAKDLTKGVFDFTFSDASADALNDARERTIRRLRFFFPQSDCQTVWPNFEQLLTNVDEYLSFDADYVQATGAPTQREAAEHLRRSLIENLMRMLAGRTRRMGCESAEWVKQFTQRAIEDSATIVSFNWDCLIEVACQTLGARVTYANETPEALHLIKPHGSINLVEPTIPEYNEARHAANVKDLEELERHGDRVVLRALDPSIPDDRVLSPFHSDDWLVVPPSGRKSFHSPWIKKQWRFAHDALQGASKITVIGYSLPEFDVRSRLMFLLAVVRKKQAEMPLTRIIDPYPCCVMRRIQECGYLNIDPVEGEWQDHLSELA